MHNRAMKKMEDERSPPLQEQNPWEQVSPDGQNLQVEDFITVLFSHVSNELRRKVTVPYATRHGLTVPEWRILCLIGQARSLPFTELVVQSTSDKALVSRTLKTLVERGLVRTETVGANWRQGVICHTTPAGQRMYKKVMPEARRAQAQMILALDPEERRVMHRALLRLSALCAAPD